MPIRPSHITSLAALPDLHRDPFDRILIAQAVAEGLSLVSSDKRIAAYPVTGDLVSSLVRQVGGMYRP